MKKVFIYSAILLGASIFTACSNQEILSLDNNESVLSRSGSEADALPKSPLYLVGSVSNGSAEATPVEAIDENLLPYVAQLNVTVTAPQALTLTGVSVTTDGGKQYFAEFRNGDCLNFVELAKGETVNFTLAVAPSSNLNVRLHATGSSNITTTVSGNFTAGSEQTLSLNSFTVATGNNWITPLSDNLYVSQLSIPGTHDAATGNGMSISSAETQDLTLQEQWDMGIRVFDLRPGYKKVRKSLFKYENQLYIYHGIFESKVSWADAMSTLATNLDKNPGEFAIVVMRFENDSPLYNNRSTWNSLMSTYLNSTMPSSKKVNFSPYLTVGDLRGKILILSRDSYADSPITGAFVSNWSHSSEGSTSGVISGNGGTASLNIQDYYDVDDTSAKLASIYSFMQLASSNTDPAVWTINHTSGYTGTSAYRKNAANNNPSSYNRIIARDGSASCTGLMLMDFVGNRKSSSYTVYGDLLPQAIIDNNYRY